jgi:predicted TIM-barrel fold metal-dependent hydrolase
VEEQRGEIRHRHQGWRHHRRAADPRYRGDIGVAGGRIVEIGSNIVAADAAVIIAHGLFERFPRLKFAFVENGGLWVGPLLHDLQVVHSQNTGMFAKNPVDQFHENCWVAPFVEDDVAELAKHIPVERTLFGSDWPHAEGVATPRDFLGFLDAFSDADVRKIMGDNARALTYA